MFNIKCLVYTGFRVQRVDRGYSPQGRSRCGFAGWLQNAPGNWRR